MITLTPEETAALKTLLKRIDMAAVPGIHRPVLEKLYRKLTQDLSAKLYIDGAADLHSRTAGIGGVFIRNGEELYSFSQPIGPATNNEAEYKALLKGLKLALEMNILRLEIFSDSELLVKQIRGEYRVKNPRLKPLYALAQERLQQLHVWRLDHIPRNDNRRADQLSKSALRKDQQS
jgi:ribonuclease HI